MEAHGHNQGVLLGTIETCYVGFMQLDDWVTSSQCCDF